MSAQILEFKPLVRRRTGREDYLLAIKALLLGCDCEECLQFKEQFDEHEYDPVV